MFHSCERSNEYGERGAGIYIAHTARGPSPLHVFRSRGEREGERELWSAGSRGSQRVFIIDHPNASYLAVSRNVALFIPPVVAQQAHEQRWHRHFKEQEREPSKKATVPTEYQKEKIKRQTAIIAVIYGCPPLLLSFGKKKTVCVPSHSFPLPPESSSLPTRPPATTAAAAKACALLRRSHRVRQGHVCLLLFFLDEHQAARTLPHSTWLGGVEFRQIETKREKKQTNTRQERHKPINQKQTRRIKQKKRVSIQHRPRNDYGLHGNVQPRLSQPCSQRLRSEKQKNTIIKTRENECPSPPSPPPSCPPWSYAIFCRFL